MVLIKIELSHQLKTMTLLALFPPSVEFLPLPNRAQDNIFEHTEQGRRIELSSLSEQPTNSPLQHRRKINHFHSLNDTYVSESNISQQRHQVPLTWMQLLQTHHQLYEFAWLTGIIYPIGPISPSHESPTSSSTIYHNQYLRWKQCWVILFNLFIYSYIITTMIGIIWFTPHDDNRYNVGLVIINLIISVIPAISMVIGMTQIRRNIAVSNKQSTKSDDVSTIDTDTTSDCHSNGWVFQFYSFDQDKFDQAIQSALTITWRLFICFGCLFLIFFIVQTINIATSIYGFGNDSIGIIIVSDMFVILQDIFVFVIGVGVYGFILIEQQISYQTMNYIKQLALLRTLTDKLYLQIEYAMNYRDKYSSLNWVFTGTTISALLGIGLICTALFGGKLQHTTLGLLLTYVAFIVVHQIIILLVFLYVMLTVNAVIDELLETFSKRSYEDIFSSSSEVITGDLESTTKLIKDEQRFRRLVLYLVMRENKIGTKIWSYRPTKLQLLFQILSIVTVVATTLLKIIVVNASD